MKKLLIFGGLLCAFLVVTTPAIPAQQYVLVNNSAQTAIDTKTSQLNLLMEDCKNQNELKKNNMIDELNDFNSNLKGQSSTDSFLSNLVVSLMLAFFGTLFGAVFGPLIVVLIKIITLPAVMLANVISSIF